MNEYVLTHSGQQLDEAIGKVLNNYIDTSDATATSSQLLSGYSAYANGKKIIGGLSLSNVFVGTTLDNSKGIDGDIFVIT